MEALLAKPEKISPFYKGTAIQFAWNSSSLSTYKECPRKYCWNYIEGWTPLGMGLHLRFGDLYHKALELYDRCRVSGDDADTAMDRMVDFILTRTWDGRDEGGDGGAPWDTNDSKKNRETLLRSVVWYVDHYANDPTSTVIQADGQPALELTFKMEIPLDTPRGEPYLFTGHMDRLVTFGDDKFVMDRKTTGSTLGGYYFEGFNPDNQMSLYTFASRTIYDVPVSGVIIDAAQIAVGFTSFSRGMTTRSEGQLTEWLRDVGYWLQNAERHAQDEYWPMNDQSCHKYGGCQYRGICNKDPQVRSNFLKTMFVQSDQASARILSDE